MFEEEGPVFIGIKTCRRCCFVSKCEIYILLGVRSHIGENRGVAHGGVRNGMKITRLLADGNNEDILAMVSLRLMHPEANELNVSQAKSPRIENCSRVRTGWLGFWPSDISGTEAENNLKHVQIVANETYRTRPFDLGPRD
jgi:hypothetical protein